MRILDLGAHDGFVSNWIGRQLDGDVHVDGIELNSEAVAIAQKRAARDGIEGEYVVGLAEDAPTLFQPESYDAVVAFELIEHVPDVDAFLDACETMATLDGRIYLSTPDGVFGSGQNPHHLRTYRAIDIFELCRRRGRVHDMHVGGDGVVVISYTPHTTPRLGEAAVFCGPGWEAWSPDDIETRGLGGSETAAVRTAEGLAALGYDVTVYGPENNAVFWKQVSFRDHRTFDPTVERAVLVASRTPQLFDRPINARTKLLWCHDTSYGDAVTPERVERMDRVVVLSEWHRGHVVDAYPFIPESKVVVSRNGIEPSYFPADKIPPTKDRPMRAIYSSSPDRGLDFLLEIWPDVRAMVPDAELVYCYADVYDKIAEVNPDIAKFRDRVRELAQQDGVTNLGALSQDRLAAAMATSRVWLAPSWSTPSDAPFNETFCIGAWESVAAGCRRVVSSWGALRERAAEDPEQTAIVTATMGGLEGKLWTDAVIEQLLREDDAPRTVLGRSWSGVAEQIMRLDSP